MESKKAIRFSVLILIMAVMTSCVRDVDFSQSENIVPTPTLEADLIYSSLRASQFIDADTQMEATTIIDTVRLEYINSEFFIDQLLKTNLTFQFTNSLERAFLVDFEYLNNQDELRYFLQIEIPQGSPSNPVTVETNVLIEEPNLSIFEEAIKLVYKITLPPASNPLESTDQGELKLQSKSTFYFEI